MDVNLKELELKSLEVELLFEQLKKDFSAYLNDTECPDGVTEHGKYMTVKSSALMKSDNWSPHYWNSKSQAEMIMKSLSKASTVSQFKTLINKMIEAKKVVVGAESIKLNDKIIEKLVNALNYEVGVVNDKI